MRVNFGSSDHTLFNACYKNRDKRQYIRAVWKNYHHWVQGYNNNNETLKFQAEYTEGIDVHELNITEIKQSQTINAIVEVI